MRNSLLISALLLATHAASAVEIALREEAHSVTGELVRLRDVATLSGEGAEALANAPLMPAPAPGTVQHLSAGAVRDMLAAQGHTPGTLRFRGAYRVRVATDLQTAIDAASTADSAWRPVNPARPEGTAFRVRSRYESQPATIAAPRTRPLAPKEVEAVEARVATAVAAALQPHQPASGPRLAVRGVELTTTSLQALAAKPTGGLVASFGATPPTAAVKTPFALTAEDAAEPVRGVADLVEQPYRTVATAPLAKGSLVTTSAVKLELVPLEELARPLPPSYASLEEAIGREATRAVRAGETLSDVNTAPPLMVRRGEEVVVVSGAEGITVSLTVMATQEGRVGDLVTVQTADKSDKFIARVVGPRRLAVLAGGAGLADSASIGGLR